MNDIFDIIDTSGNIIGTATRKECHTGSFLLHRVVHVMVETTDGRVVLQKRSLSKDIQPGKWDTSIGGHVDQGESVHDALVRESREELGITDAEFEPMYEYIMKSDVEREMVSSYHCIWDGPLMFDPEEIDAIKQFTCSEIETHLGSGYFTPNFEDEWKRYSEWLKRKNLAEKVQGE